MRMPYLVMLGIVKHIRIKYLMQNEEWREAYQRYLMQEAYKQGWIKKQAPDISAALAASEGGAAWQP